ncbi:MAG: ROK family protein [Verrucomicrobiales bacterium]
MIIHVPNKMPDYGIGIDLGGTGIKAAAIDLQSGECLSRATLPTRDGERDGEVPGFVSAAREIVCMLTDEISKPAGVIGVSAPGLAREDGMAIAYMPGRLDGLEELDWGEVLHLKEPVKVLNDAHAALLGELWQGACRGAADAVMLTLGTGVGGAILSGGKLLRGAIGRAGHIGHMSVDFEGHPDICGTPGSLEDAIGNATLASRCEGMFADTHQLVSAYAAGDERAARVWLRSLRALAAAVVSLANMLDPQIIVIGGGIAEAGENLFGPLEDLVGEREWQPAGQRVDIVPAMLGSWAGAYGAVYNSRAPG